MFSNLTVDDFVQVADFRVEEVKGKTFIFLCDGVKLVDSHATLPNLQSGMLALDSHGSGRIVGGIER